MDTNLYKNKIMISVIVSIFLAGCSVTPKELTTTEINNDIKLLKEKLENNNKIVNRTISLDDAMNLSIEHNLKRRIDTFSIALAETQLSSSKLDMLPEIVANAGYSSRDSYQSSRSDSIDPSTSQITNELNSYSTSQEKEVYTSSAAFSWNVLDFGLSYVRAQQMADGYLIAKEKAKKSIHQIEQETRFSYYQVYAGELLIKQLEAILTEVKDAYASSNSLAEKKFDMPIHHYTYQRELLNAERTLSLIRKHLLKARINLTELMGLKPGTKYNLNVSDNLDYKLPKLKVSIDLLEEFALEKRPELQEARYKVKISQKEIKSVIMKLLPNFNVYAGYNYDSNEYLLNESWKNAGINISWNLLNVFKYEDHSNVAKLQEEIAKQEKIALAMAVVSQVHISILQFRQAKEEFNANKKYLNVSKSIYDIVEKETLADVKDRLSFIKEKVNYLIAVSRLASSYADVQNAFAAINVSIGRNVRGTNDILTDSILIKESQLLKDENHDSK